MSIEILRMNVTPIVLGFAMVSGALFAEDGVGVWIKTDTGTSPQSATDYSTPGNWQGEYVPSGIGAKAQFPNDYSQTRYVKLPSMLTLGGFYADGSDTRHTALLGDSVTLAGEDAPGNLYYLSVDGFNQFLFANVDAPNGLQFVYSVLCGKVVCGAGKNLTFAGGKARIDLFRFADSGAANRTDDITTDCIYVGSCNTYITAPGGMSAVRGGWATVKGSPYLRRINDAVLGESLSVGAPVSNAALPEGAFVKRIFSDDYIEVSQNALSSTDGDWFDFGEFAPTTTVALAQLVYSTENNGLFVQSKAAGSVFRLEPHRMVSSQPSFVWNFRTEPGCVPGTIVTHDTSMVKAQLVVENAHFEFGATDVDKPGFPAAAYLSLMNAASTVRFTVPTGVDAEVSRLQNLVGTVVKDGVGSLSAVVGGAVSGAIEIKEGELALSEAEAGIGVDIARLKIASGAALRLAGGIVRIEQLESEAGARIVGTGVVECAAGVSLDGVILGEGVQVSLPAVKGSPVFSVPEGRVVGTPAFWVDASRFATDMKLDGTSVLQWNDCRGGESDGYLFATNVVVAPMLCEDGKGFKYVRFTWNSSLTDPDITKVDVLVWSQVLRGIRAVFCVMDPTDGGGYLLGRSPRISDDEVGVNGAWYRSFNAWYTPLAHAAMIDSVRNGAFYLNGERIDATACGFKGPFLQLVEAHPVAPGAPADAFGSGFSWTYPGGGSMHGGCQRIYEYIIYTNELTHAERLQTAQYLTRKWRGCDVSFEEMPAGQGVGELGAAGGSGGVVVKENEMLRADGIGGGTLTKTGKGTLYLESATKGSLRVAEGQAVVRSYALSRGIVPTDSCFIHLDAADPTTLETNVADNVTSVSRWLDCRGNGQYAAKTNRDNTPNAMDGLLKEDAMNGLPMVDLGPLRYNKIPGWSEPTPNRQLQFYKADGSTYPEDNYSGTSAPAVKSAFIVYGSANGGGALLSARGDDYPIRGFYPGISEMGAAPTTIFSVDENIGMNDFRWSLEWNTPKAQVCRQNGVPFDPFATGFSGGNDIFVWASDYYPRQTAGLGAIGYDYYAGGLSYGEVILFSNYIGAEKAAQIEAYLMKKWKGVETPGYVPAVLDTLEVAAGATAKIVGDAPLKVTTLKAAGGTVDGLVDFVSGVQLEVAVQDDGSLQNLLMPDMEFTAGGVIRITGDLRKLAVGEHRILTAKGVAETGWQIVTEVGKQKRAFDIAIRDGSLYVAVSKFGMAVFVR